MTNTSARRTNAERQDALWEEDEARLIAECTAVLTRHAGKAPRGWLGPYFAQSANTLDLLKKAGYDYVMDWPADDQSFWMLTRSRPILSVPYSVEVNDSPALVLRQHTGRDFEEMIIDQFEEMLRRSRSIRWFSAFRCTHSLSASLSACRGCAERLILLRRRESLWITVPGEIANYCMSLPPGMVPRPLDDG